MGFDQGSAPPRVQREEHRLVSKLQTDQGTCQSPVLLPWERPSQTQPCGAEHMRQRRNLKRACYRRQSKDCQRQPGRKQRPPKPESLTASTRSPPYRADHTATGSILNDCLSELAWFSLFPSGCTSQNQI